MGINYGGSVVKKIKKDYACKPSELTGIKEDIRKIYPKGTLPCITNEKGLYRLLYRSNAPLAEDF